MSKRYFATYVRFPNEETVGPLLVCGREFYIREELEIDARAYAKLSHLPFFTVRTEDDEAAASAPPAVEQPVIEAVSAHPIKRQRRADIGDVPKRLWRGKV